MMPLETLIKDIEKLPEASYPDLDNYIKYLLYKYGEKPERKRQRKLGALEGGLIYMADDFDAPLEEFKDYM